VRFAVTSKPVFYARASLVDRLVDLRPRAKAEERPLRTLSREGYRESLRRNLSWILNTRTSIPADVFEREELTVLEYGIPDFGGYSPENSEHQELMARRISKALRAYEPRLQDVEVRIRHGMPDEKALIVDIEGVLVGESSSEPVSFQTVFQKDSGIWEVHERPE
jgi:type VI secretion system protein ImpF